MRKTLTALVLASSIGCAHQQSKIEELEAKKKCYTIVKAPEKEHYQSYKRWDADTKRAEGITKQEYIKTCKKTGRADDVTSIRIILINGHYIAYGE